MFSFLRTFHAARTSRVVRWSLGRSRHRDALSWCVISPFALRPNITVCGHCRTQSVGPACETGWSNSHVTVRALGSGEGYLRNESGGEFLVLRVRPRQALLTELAGGEVAHTDGWGATAGRDSRALSHVDGHLFLSERLRLPNFLNSLTKGGGMGYSGLNAVIRSVRAGLTSTQAVNTNPHCHTTVRFICTNASQHKGCTKYHDVHKTSIIHE